MDKQTVSWAARRKLLAAGALAGLAGSLPSRAAEAATAAAGGGVVTILDGPALVVQGIAKLAVVEGLRLNPGDLLITSANTGLLRIEGPGGELLSLGPQTELMLTPRFAGRAALRGMPWFYLMRGWVKTNRGFASPAWDVTTQGAELVAALREGQSQLFVESGNASLVEAGVAAQALSAGTFAERKGVAKLTKGRPAADFIEQMPRPFLDTLPPRAALFAQSKVQPKPLGAPSYAELKAWLTAELSLRQALMKRWQPLVQGEFRRALEQNLVAHPEWERLLYPERFLPKTP